MTAELAPGTDVVVALGRHRGARAVLVAIESIPTPSGSSVSVARIRRPRAGESYVFTSDVRLASAEVPAKQELASEEFRP